MSIKCNVVFAESASDINKSMVKYFYNVHPKLADSVKIVFSVDTNKAYSMYPVLLVENKAPVYGIREIQVYLDKFITINQQNKMNKLNNPDAMIDDYQQSALLEGVGKTPDGKFDTSKVNDDNDDMEQIKKKREVDMAKAIERRKITTSNTPSSRGSSIGSSSDEETHMRSSSSAEPSGGFVNKKNSTNPIDIIEQTDEFKNDSMMKQFFEKIDG